LSDTTDRPASAAAETDHSAPRPEGAVAPAEAPAYGEAGGSLEDAATEVEPTRPDLAAAGHAADPEDAAATDPAAEADPEAPTEEEDAAEDGEEPAAPRVTFADLGLSEPVLRAVAEAGYVTPTPIQEQAIPVVLMGRDVLGTAQTGTGKTAGFTLPMLDILSNGRAKARMPRSLILEPTRELALQVAEQFEKYGRHLKLNHALLIGGESMNEQRDVLDKGVDVLIATPGRLLDLFERGRILLADCKLLVIDEADRMLDMGFIPDVERIVSLLPQIRQTLFFSATMAPEIRRLSDAFLTNPKEIAVAPPASVAATIVAGLVWVREHDKREALRRLVRREQVQNALIFCNRKVEVDVLYKSLKRHGFDVGALHGDMDQPTRFATLNKFKEGELRLLVCSDVAARGLDIGGLSHVFNFDVPFRDEDYVHRIGRTGRAGREGHAFTIATADDARLVAAIEALTGKPIPRIEIEGLDGVSPEEIAEAAARPRQRGRGGAAAGRGRGGGRSGSGGERSRAQPDGRRERGGSSSAASPRSGAGRSERTPRRTAAGQEDRRRAEGDAVAERAAAPAAREAGAGDRPAGDDRQRPPRGDRPRAPREDRPREDRARDDRPREDRGGRDDRGAAAAARRRDDPGPPVRGFGDSVPAFMLVPVPRPRREARADADPPEAEAA
jgi:superfamily II DNA/RNA helicase